MIGYVTIGFVETQNLKKNSAVRLRLFSFKLSCLFMPQRLDRCMMENMRGLF